jgi:TRAP-type C4-dicarboxylate transport system permease small subunit
MRAPSSTGDRPGRRTPFAVVLRTIGRVHDGLTEAGVRLAMAGLAVIVVAYVFEVVARYGFDAPTRWSADLVSYLLLFVTFMAMPEVTRQGGHVAVTVLVERLPPRARSAMARGVAGAGALICFALADLAADETARQFRRDIHIMAALPVPKGWISIWIVYGFASSGLHFARLTLQPRQAED